MGTPSVMGRDLNRSMSNGVDAQMLQASCDLVLANRGAPDSIRWGHLQYQDDLDQKSELPKANRVNRMVPELKRKDLKNMIPDERDEVIEHSELLTIDWVHAFLEEVNRIEGFFV